MDLRSRRGFLSAVGTAAIGAAFVPRIMADSLKHMAWSMDPGLSPLDAAADEKFWADIRKGFDLPEGILNLDNGYCNPLSRAVMDDLVNSARQIGQLPSKRLEEFYNNVTEKQTIPGIAKILGVPADEIALTRNATEALDTVILGTPLKAGDEIVCSAHDYYAMLDAIEQRRGRDGIVVKMIEPPLPAPSMDALVDLYQRAINSRTKLVLVTHASNLTGQIYPVKRIAAAAHRAGARVICDAAQTFALADHKITDLDCDYYGISLHKWLMAPVGAGVLWMRKELEAKTWPLVPPPGFVKGMQRFQWSGTYPEFISSAAAPAIKFHENLGAARKEERLRYLARHLRAKLQTIDALRFYTTDDAGSSCGLTVFEVAGVSSEKLQKHLWEQHKVLVQYMSSESRDPRIKGIRVTPNIYTTPGELDRFAGLVADAVKKGTLR